MPSISLKQRLAALSLSPTSSHSSTHDHDTRSPRRKAIFTPPWVKRPQHEVNAVDDESAAIQEVLSKMIFQAGVDFETRPMVVLNASALPDPRQVSYDVLLVRIMSYLDLYVESDYTVIFFAAGVRHSPSWNWVWKAYRGLNRKYRKHLKQLYIVHTSFFSKMLFSLAGAIISPKFFRKIEYISTLSELATLIPLTQIDIPPAVYQENLKFEKRIVLPVPTRSNIFGVPLEELMGYDGEKGGLPRVVKDSIHFLREKGLLEEGIFRRSPSSTMLRAAQEAYDRGNVLSLDTFGDPYLAAVLLKKYLRDLPEPIFPESLYPLIRRCPAPTSEPSDMSSVEYIRDTLLPSIPPCAYILLNQILHLAHDVSLRAGTNKMDAHNLAIVLCPNLVKGSNPVRDVMMCAVPGTPAILSSNVPTQPTGNHIPHNSLAEGEGRATLGMVIKLCIQRYYEIFDEVWDRSEAVPPSRSLQESNTPGFYSYSTSERSSASASPQPQVRPQQQQQQQQQQPSRAPVVSSSDDDDDDEEIDDAMLIMPIGPGGSKPSTPPPPPPPLPSSPSSPPSAWASSSTPNGSPSLAYKPYTRAANKNNGSSSSRVRSLHTTSGDGSSFTAGGTGQAYSSMNKARSMISIENTTSSGGGGGSGSTARMGSIAIGRGTTRKSSGAAVEAIGITAEGFFTAPTSAPPVPKRDFKFNDSGGGS